MTSNYSTMETTFDGVNELHLINVLKACSLNSQTNESNTPDVKSKSYLDRIYKGNRPFVWLLGPPGTGKRSQGSTITHRLNFIHISVPELVVEESKVSSPRGERVAMLLRSKSKLPDDIALTLLKEALTKLSLKNNKPPAWLVSGYPRLLSEAYRFEREVGRCGLILYLWADPSLLAERITQKSSSSGYPTPTNLVYYLEKYHVRILPLLQTYSDRVEFIDASKLKDDILFDILTVLRSFMNNPPPDNLITYDTQWLNFKQRADLADEFFTKIPHYVPVNNNTFSYLEYIPHWLDVENSCSQIQIMSQENEKNEQTQRGKTKSSTNPDSGSKPRNVGKKTSQSSSRIVPSQEVRKEKKGTGKNSLRKYIQHNKRTNKRRALKSNPVARNKKLPQKISRKRSDVSRKSVSSSIQEVDSEEWNEKPNTPQSLLLNKRSVDQFVESNPSLRPSSMAVRVINAIHAERKSFNLRPSENELPERELKRDTEKKIQSLTKNLPLSNDEKLRDGSISATSTEREGLSRPKSIRDVNDRLQKRVERISSQDIRHMLKEVSESSRIALRPSKVKREVTEREEKGPKKREQTSKSSGKNCLANSSSHRHDEDGLCSRQQDAKHEECASQLSDNQFKLPQSASPTEWLTEFILNSLQESTISTPPNQSSKSDQPLAQENVGDNKSVSKLETCSLKSKGSSDTLICKSSVSLIHGLSNLAESNTSEFLKSTSFIESLEKIVRDEPNISLATLSKSRCGGNCVTEPNSSHILRNIVVPKFIQISRSLSDTQKGKPLHIQVVMNKSKIKDMPIPVIDQKSLIMSFVEVINKVKSEENEEAKNRNSSHLCKKDNLGSNIYYEPRTIEISKEVVTESLTKENVHTTEELKNSANKMKTHSSDFPAIIYETDSEMEKEIMPTVCSGLCVPATPERSGSGEKNPSVGSSETGIIRQIVASSSVESGEINNFCSRKQEKIVPTNSSGNENKTLAKYVDCKYKKIVSITNDENDKDNQTISKILKNGSSSAIFASRNVKINDSIESTMRGSASAIDKKRIQSSKQLSSLSNITNELSLTETRVEKNVATISIPQKHISPSPSSAKSGIREENNKQINNNISTNSTIKQEGEKKSLEKSKSVEKLSSITKKNSAKNTGECKTLKSNSRSAVTSYKSLTTVNHEKTSTKPDTPNDRKEQKAKQEPFKKNNTSNSTGNFISVVNKNKQSTVPTSKFKKNSSVIISVSLSVENNIIKSDPLAVLVGDPNIQSQTSDEVSEKAERLSSKKTTREKSSENTKTISRKKSSDKNTTSATKTRKNFSNQKELKEKCSSKSDSSKNIESEIPLENSQSVDQKLEACKSGKSYEKVGHSSEVDRSQVKTITKIISKKKIMFDKDPELQNTKSNEHIIVSSTKPIKSRSKDLEILSSKPNKSSQADSSKRVNSAFTIKQSQSSEQDTTKEISDLTMEVSGKEMTSKKSQSAGKLVPKMKYLEKNRKCRNDSNYRANSSTELHGDTQPSKKSIKNSPKNSDVNSETENTSNERGVLETIVNDLKSSEENNAGCHTKETPKCASLDIHETSSKSKSIGKILINKKSCVKSNTNKRTANLKLPPKTETLHNALSKKSTRNSSKVEDVENNHSKNKKIEISVNSEMSESSKEKNLPSNPVSKANLKKKEISETHESTKKQVYSKSLSKRKIVNESNAQNVSRDRPPTKEGSKTKTSSTPPVTKTGLQNKGLTLKSEPSSKTQSSVKETQLDVCTTPRKIKSNVSAPSTTDESMGKLDAQQKTGSARKATSATTKISVKCLPSSQKDDSRVSSCSSNDRQSTKNNPTELADAQAKSRSKPIVKFPQFTNDPQSTNSDDGLKIDEGSKSGEMTKSTGSSTSSSSRPDISFYYKLCSSIQKYAQNENQPHILKNQILKGRKIKSKPQWVAELPDLEETSETKTPTSDSSLNNSPSIQNLSSSKSVNFDTKNKGDASQPLNLHGSSIDALSGPTFPAPQPNKSSSNTCVPCNPLHTRSNLFCDNSLCDSSRESSAATQRPPPRYSSPRPRRGCRKPRTPLSSGSSDSICESPVALESSPEASKGSLFRNRSSISFVF